jgi:PAS domain S-box-containing protein
MIPPARYPILARGVARGGSPSDLLLDLHREALSATGGARSVVLQPAGRAGDYAATSGRGVEEVGGIWLGGPEATALTQLAREPPHVRGLFEMPALQRRIQADAALVVPLPGPGSVAFLVVAAPQVAPAEAAEFGARACDEFTIALELARLEGKAALHNRIQELFLRFSRGISATLNVGAALESLSIETNALFGARQTSVWLHDRRARELVRAGSSAPGRASGSLRVPTESDSPAARGLRLDRPEERTEGDAPVLITPLRGWRRALGTLVIEGEPSALDDQQALYVANEVGRQLSVTIENVQLLEEMLQRRRLLEDTFNSLIDLVVVTDTGLRIVQTNDAFTARVGSTRAAVHERPLAELIGVEMARWVATEPATDRSDASGKNMTRTARTTQVTDERLDGIFAATVTPLINHDGEPVGRVLVARDVTAQSRLESEREALRERLAQSEKLAALGQFVAGIAHEMNNPLQGVLGHLELLIETPGATPALRATLRRIYQEGDRAAKIVRNLLVFAGSRRMSRQRLRLERIVGRALASRAAALRRNGIEVTRTVADTVPEVAGDALLLQQALLNILINAEYATAGTGAPGRIDVEIAPTSDGRTVRLIVSDTGPGIPAHILPRIFDPFFTTKEVGQGTGLGLAITYGIIQEHGGRIEAANRTEGGARFVIELPALTPTERRKPRAAPAIRKRKNVRTSTRKARKLKPAV